MRNLWHNESPTDSSGKPFGKTREKAGEIGRRKALRQGTPSHRAPADRNRDGTPSHRPPPAKDGAPKPRAPQDAADARPGDAGARPNSVDARPNDAGTLLRARVRA